MGLGVPLLSYCTPRYRITIIISEPSGPRALLLSRYAREPVSPRREAATRPDGGSARFWIPSRPKFARRPGVAATPFVRDRRLISGVFVCRVIAWKPNKSTTANANRFFFRKIVYYSEKKGVSRRAVVRDSRTLAIGYRRNIIDFVCR